MIKACWAPFQFTNSDEKLNSEPTWGIILQVSKLVNFWLTINASSFYCRLTAHRLNENTHPLINRQNVIYYFEKPPIFLVFLPISHKHSANLSSWNAFFCTQTLDRIKPKIPSHHKFIQRIIWSRIGVKIKSFSFLKWFLLALRNVSTLHILCKLFLVQCWPQPNWWESPEKRSRKWA